MRIILPLICGAFLVFAPIFADDVDVDFDKAQDFAKFKTFRMLEGTIDAKSPALKNEIVRKNLESDIRERLKANGLTEASAEVQPDVNVRFHLGSARRTDTTAVPAGRFGQRTRVVKSQTTEGTLTIDLLVKRELVWRAVAVDDNKDPAKIADHLDDMVKKAIGKYPPKK
jgi:hypothetical protein